MFIHYAQKRNPAKLSQKSASAYRQMMTAEQGGKDFITGSPLTDPVIDHDHRTGHCRLILNRVTNAIEGDFNRVARQFRLQLFQHVARRNGFLKEDDFGFILKQFAVYYAVRFDQLHHLEYYR